MICSPRSKFFHLTLLHSERPKLYTILAFLSAIGLRVDPILKGLRCFTKASRKSQKLFPLVKKIENHLGVLIHIEIIMYLYMLVISSKKGSY